MYVRYLSNNTIPTYETVNATMKRPIHRFRLFQLVYTAPTHLKDGEQALPEAVEVVPRLVVLGAKVESTAEHLRNGI